MDQSGKRLRVDDKNYVYIDGAKVCRYIPERKTLEFVDHDRQRKATRGSRFVEVGILELLKTLTKRGDSG